MIACFPMIRRSIVLSVWFASVACGVSGPSGLSVCLPGYGPVLAGAAGAFAVANARFRSLRRGS